jgi:hypothetical protein
MATLQRRQYQVFIDRPPKDVFEFHASLKNYARIAPAEQQEAILEENENAAALTNGMHIRWRMRLGGLWQVIETEICDLNCPSGFAERQVAGPFAQFLHRRRFAPFQSGTLFTETVEYAPVGPLGALADRLWMGKFFDSVFTQRHREAKRLLELLTQMRGRDVTASHLSPSAELPEDSV